MRAKTVNFERGLDPKKAMGIGRVRPYPEMTPQQFKNWFWDEIIPYIDDDGVYAIHDNLIKNTWESDSEIYGYLFGRIKSDGIVSELIEMRDYFNDDDYINVLPS